MAKAKFSPTDTPRMSSKSSKKSSQPPKAVGKQTTLFGFFSKSSTPSNQTTTPVQKRVESRANLPLTPLPSSELGDEVSPDRLPVRQHPGASRRQRHSRRDLVAPRVRRQPQSPHDREAAAGVRGRARGGRPRRARARGPSPRHLAYY